jgi:hypothetical protein
VPEELSEAPPKRLISQSNHSLEKSPKASLARSGFVEKGGREWTGALPVFQGIGLLEHCPKYIYEFRTGRGSIETAMSMLGSNSAKASFPNKAAGRDRCSGFQKI